ncbi:MAG TPA: hypothetical protein VL485_02865 [Ktedonobacteraceae bacterium]|jgi:hypothetical protein|nr:hypothetical protein [Ktedonobacteraceae bacterium]
MRWLTSIRVGFWSLAFLSIGVLLQSFQQTSRGDVEKGWNGVWFSVMMIVFVFIAIILGALTSKTGWQRMGTFRKLLLTLFTIVLNPISWLLVCATFFIMALFIPTDDSSSTPTTSHLGFEMQQKQWEKERAEREATR